MELRTLIDSTLTDKDTLHSYLETYENLFKEKRYTSKAIMEIGIAEGGSIKLWNDYFINARIFGLDIMSMKNSVNDIKYNYPRINLSLNTDAYNIDVNVFKNKFDIIIEDGDHLLSNQIKFLKNYLSLLEEDGIMIIEDIQRVEDIEILTNETPEEYKQYIEVYDLRANKGRYDDILFVINKNKRI
jgi:cyclopropane fatty-acyl-phospholipid synthase-like methyltransferase